MNEEQNETKYMIGIKDGWTIYEYRKKDPVSGEETSRWVMVYEPGCGSFHSHGIDWDRVVDAIFFALQITGIICWTISAICFYIAAFLT